MATKKKHPETPRLRGSPGKLSGVVHFETAATLAPVADLPEIRVDSAWVAVHRPTQTEGPAVMHIKLGLPQTTPPGSYLAVVPIDGDDHQIVVDVEPRSRLRISPRSLSVKARPGAKVPADLTVANLGNIPAPLPRNFAMGMFDTFGLDRAIGRAFRPAPPKGERRIDILGEELAKELPGLLAIKLKGPEEVAPGDSARFDLELHIPNQAEPGHTYFGFVRLQEVRYSIHVEVLEGTVEAGPATPRTTPRRRSS